MVFAVNEVKRAVVLSQCHDLFGKTVMIRVRYVDEVGWIGVSETNVFFLYDLLLLPPSNQEPNLNNVIPLRGHHHHD